MAAQKGNHIPNVTNELPLNALLLTSNTNFCLINAEYNKVSSFCSAPISLRGLWSEPIMLRRNVVNRPLNVCNMHYRRNSCESMQCTNTDTQISFNIVQNEIAFKQFNSQES